jgi:hypothetical protein
MFEDKEQAKRREKNPTFMYMLVYIHKPPLNEDGARGTGQPPL